MKKDIMLIRVPTFYSDKEHYNVEKYFYQKFDKYYDLIIYESKDITELKVELLNPTLLNYIKYKFRNIFNYGK